MSRDLDFLPLSFVDVFHKTVFSPSENDEINGPANEVEAPTAVEQTDENDADKLGSSLDKIPIGLEAAKEAEERAARERAVQPLEVRVRRFREMLVEMQVCRLSS